MQSDAARRSCFQGPDGIDDKDRVKSLVRRDCVSRRATRTPAASSERRELPIPRTAILGGLFCRAVHCCRDICQGLGDILFLPIIDSKVLLYFGVLPIFMRHAHALEFAVDHTLTAIDTAIHVIFHHIPFGGAVQDDQLDGIRRAILNA